MNPSIALRSAVGIIALAISGCGARTGLSLAPDLEGPPAAGSGRDGSVDAPVQTVAGLALGGSHSCARLFDGRVKCWGMNIDGEIGDGTTTERHTPTLVVGLADAVEVSLGSLDHTCARIRDGTVICWGSGSYGQIGDGETSARAVPTPTLGLTGASQIATGSRHTCALLDDATMSCWGRNLEGELGDGTLMNRAVPTKVRPLRGLAEIALGYSFSCARFSDAGGEVTCWGMNADGQLGDGTFIDRALPEKIVPLPAPAYSLVAGGAHVCARIADGRTLCWGDNRQGELGDGTTTQRDPIVGIPNLGSAAELVFGLHHSCARFRDGTLKCWGANSSGQLGDGTTTPRLSPTRIEALDDVVEVALGSFHTCARLATGAVKCWGANGNGQLGDGTTVDRHLPTLVVW